MQLRVQRNRQTIAGGNRGRAILSSTSIRAGLILLLMASAQRSCRAEDDWSLKSCPDLREYFAAEVDKIEAASDLTKITSSEEWLQKRDTLRQQFRDMLGLDPLPEKTPLNVVVHGIVEEKEFVVERISFESRAGLLVTGNLYRPREFEKPLPAILYLCGHGQVKKDGISYGNKTHYQHHGAWFARNGYVCLTIDTLQLGEIEGIHHGTSRYNRWWWNSRGYTPAGVEAWNAVRAIDYLCERPEVDGSRIGVTGRSGGGASTWWIAAIDDRVQCAVPVAGITSLRDHVVLGCVEGHCDCMYHINTERWDFHVIAALIAPRPLLISNTDKDRIFPLEGVLQVHQQVRHVYQLLKADANLGLQITEGPHADTQELHIHAFRWFNRFLRDDLSPVQTVAVKYFQPEQLRVFQALPEKELNTVIDQSFVAPAELPSPETVLANPERWSRQTLEKLRERCFRGWPDSEATVGISSTKMSPVQQSPEAKSSIVVAEEKTENGITKRSVLFDSQPSVRLRLEILSSADKPAVNADEIHLFVTSDPSRSTQEAAVRVRETGETVAIFSPRGLGTDLWPVDAQKSTQIQRRFQLLGTTVDTMRVWDIRSALRQLRSQTSDGETLRIRVHADDTMDELTLLALLFEAPVESAEFVQIEADPERWPSILNLFRTVTPEEIKALAIRHQLLSLSAINPTEESWLTKVSLDSRWVLSR
ncbi:MAG: alpha/beta hydrolase family protein [Planctomyces sp.]